MFSYKNVSSILVLALFMNLFTLGGSSVASANGTEGPPASATDFNYVIGDFETDNDGWEYTFGEQPNIQGSFEVIASNDAHNGDHVGKLSANFTQSSRDKAAYTAIRKDFEGLELEQYAFWVKTSELKALRIRTTDATGQVFQQKMNLQDTAEWQQVVVNPITSSQFWGGANNGKWNAPAKRIAIMLDRSDIKDGKLTASLLIDTITAKLNLPDLKVKQSVMGNIFLDSDPVTFTVSTRFPGVAWQVYDLNGQLVQEGTVQTPSGSGIITATNLNLGYYTLELIANQESSAPVRLKTPFAVLSDYDWDAVPDSPFGIASHLHREAFGWSGELAQLIKYAGARTARGGYEWSIEKSPGQYTFTPQPERFMSHVVANGLNSMFVSGYNNQFYDNNMTPYTDAGREGFANYVNAYINQYKDHLVGVQVYNEFNGGFGKRGNSPADSKPDYYYKLLKKTYETVKANHPDFIVSGMVTAGIDLNWIEEVFKLGGMNYLDNVAVHPYRYGRAVVKDRAPEGMAAELEQLKQLIRDYNGGELKPIWISEFGWPTHQSPIGIDEKTQADFLARAYVIALSEGVERIVWYNLMNDGLQADYNEHNFGLIRFKDDPLGAHTPKPSYVAYAAMTRELTNAAYVEEESYGGSIKSFLFDRNGEALRAVWAVEDTNVTISTNEPLLITDLTGHSEQFVPHNGKIYLTLNGEILYVKGNMSGITEDNTFTIAGEESYIGDQAGFTVQLHNQDLANALNVELEAEGGSYTLAAAPGGNAQEHITLLPVRDSSYRSVVVTIKDGEQTIGRLRQAIAVMEANEVKVRPTLALGEDGGLEPSLELEVENLAKIKSLTVNGAVWSVGSESGEQQWNEQVEPGEKRRFIVPLEAAPVGTDLKTDIKVGFESGLPFEFEGNISFNPIMQGDGTVDIDSESALTPTIDLSKGKRILLSGHNGNIDTTGQVWLQHDKDNLYLLAEIEDDVHAVPAAGANIWNNDSIQFAIAPGIPGESQGFYEFGISDTPEGAQVYRWSNLEGKTSVAVELANAEVIRDEEQKRTTYKLALPWSELAPIKPDRAEVISFSLLVNDNDGNGRRGWVEWASGIGNEKRPSLFRSMQWIITEQQQQVPPVALDASFKVTAGETMKGTLLAEHAEGATLQFEIVDQSQKGEVKLLDAASGSFEYTTAADAVGEDGFTFRVHDGNLASNIASVSIVIEANSGTNPGTNPNPGTDPGTDPGTNPNPGTDPGTDPGTNPNPGTGPGTNPNPESNQIWYVPLPTSSTNGQLYVPAQAAGEVSLGSHVKLTIAENTTSSGTTFTLHEVQNENLLKQHSATAISPLIEVRAEPEVDLKRPLFLQLPFDGKQLTQEEHQPEQRPSIWQYDEQQQKWVEVGGEAGDGWVKAEVTRMGKFAVFAPLAEQQPKPEPEQNPATQLKLTDIEGHWGNEGIQQAVKLGIVRGYDNHTFKPNQAVSRQELISMLVRALEPQAAANKLSFTDDRHIGSWAAEDITAAASAGWINGYEDGSFRPHGELTRAELTAILMRAVGMERESDTKDSILETSGFADEDDIPAWVKGYAATAAKMGLIKGRGGNLFASDSGVTRAEAVVMIVRLLEWKQAQV